MTRVLYGQKLSREENFAVAKNCYFFFFSRLGKFHRFRGN